MTKRTRRTFTKEYKAEVVTLIRRGNKSIGAVCRELGLPETAVRRWVKRTGPLDWKSSGTPMSASTAAVAA